MESGIVKSAKVDELEVIVAEGRPALGKLAAKHVSGIINKLQAEQDEVRIVFAAAPSQNEFLAELAKDESIQWNKIIAFHMDEYIGLLADAPQLFGTYLTEHIFSKVNFKRVNLINSQAKNPLDECIEYERLLQEKQIDIVFLGIGENGHIAFNDPPVADFNDKVFVKIVELEERCKYQQVNDGCFNSIDEVPKTAYSLTIPALLAAKYKNIVVPGIRKAEAIGNTLFAEISTKCPATILRKQKDSILFIDTDSASEIFDKL
jgi:glucosamine-6-phosphate deaminase